MGRGRLAGPGPTVKAGRTPPWCIAPRGGTWFPLLPAEYLLIAVPTGVSDDELGRDQARLLEGRNAALVVYAKGEIMTESSDWDQWYADYLAAEAAFGAAFRSGVRPKPPQPAEGAVRRIAAPQPQDVLWLTEALADEERRWFVSRVARASGQMDEALFRPMLDAAINEIDPSWNRWFVEPCITAFGHRRVNEYLLDVVANGTDYQKAGAVNALYWASVHLIFPGNARSFELKNATPESRAEYEALRDVWQRQRELFLETFVSNQNVDVRRSIIAKLDLDPAHYREHLRPAVMHAIDIARSSDDNYIRHRVEVQLGNELLLRALPHRENRQDVS